MKLNIYSINDTLAGIYYMPFNCKADAIAVRNFSDVINDPDTPMYKNPTDYQLVLLGTFDDEAGLFNTHAPQFVISAVKLHAEYQNEISNGPSI